MTDEQVDRLARLDACAVSDALDALGLTGFAYGLHLVTDGGKIAGRVQTVDLRSVDGGADNRTSAPAVDGADDSAASGSARHLCTAAVEASTAGEVIAIGAGGRTDAAGWGGVLSLAAVTRGVAGVVIDGACRDVDEAVEYGLPVYGRAGVPRTARGRLKEVAWNVPVELSGVTVRPGDAVLADGSGVVFVSADQAESVLQKAEAIAAKERAMAARVRAGDPVSQVMSGDYENMLRN